MPSCLHQWITITINNTIAYQLNEMHIPSQTGTWGQTSITNILNNEVYLGMIRWKHEPTKRIVKDGMLAKKRVVSKDYELYEGLHEPIISQEQCDMVKSKQQERNHSSVNSNRQLTKPFATILFCKKCGAVMKRNDTLTREMRKLQASEDDLLKKQSSQSDIKNAEAEIIPTTQRILDSYFRLSVPLSEATYEKLNTEP